MFECCVIKPIFFASLLAKQVMDVRAGAGMTVSQSNEHLRVMFVTL
jgi:hypothetical protein